MRDLHQLGPAALLNRGEVKDGFRCPPVCFYQIELVVHHSGGEAACFGVAGNQFHVNGAARIGNADGAENLAAHEVPDTDAPAQIEPARDSGERGRRTDEVAGDHKVDLWPDRDAMGIEAVFWRMARVFADEVELIVNLRHSAGGMTLRPTHHGDQEAASGQGMEFIGDRREWRVSSRDELGSSRVRHIPEENFLLSLENAEQPTAGYDFSVCGEADMVEFVSRCTGLGQRSCGNNLPIVPRVLVEIDDCEKIGMLARLIASANQKEYPLFLLVVFCADNLRRSHQQDGAKKYVERQGCAPVCLELKHCLFL